jgi:hypothetical protein
MSRHPEDLKAEAVNLLSRGVIGFGALLIMLAVFTSPEVKTAQNETTFAPAKHLQDSGADRYVAKMQAHIKQDPRCSRYRQAMSDARKLGTSGSGAFTAAVIKAYEAAKTDQCGIPQQ